uniref:Uncharacterized protein n=1 Tax=Globodera rostochiensis TaxID=31243 RepID=A0A914HX56_GLORO
MDFCRRWKESAVHRFVSRRIAVLFPIFLLKIVLLLILTILCLFLVLKNVELRKQLDWEPPPLLLVPGLMGSKLKSWISDHLINSTDCELYLLSLSYNSKFKRFENVPNVSVGANLPGIPFGHSLWPIQCLYTDGSPQDEQNEYVRSLVLFLTSELNYAEGKTLFAAQYDWRQHLTSDVMNIYYNDLKELIEKAVKSTGKKASFEAMAEKAFARHYKCGATVWRSFGYSQRASVSEFVLLKNVSISQKQFASFFRSSAFSANLLPFGNAFGSEWLIAVGRRTFSVDQMKDFLSLVNSSQIWQFYAQNEPMPQKYVPTVEDQNPRVIFGDGDGAVNAESMRICEKWKREGNTVTVTEFPMSGNSHSAILMEQRFYKYIATILTSM